MSFEDREYLENYDAAAETDGYVRFQGQWIGPDWEDGFTWDVTFDGPIANWTRVPGTIIPEDDRIRLLTDAETRIDALKAATAEKLGITTDDVTTRIESHVASHVQSYDGHPGLPNAETEPLLRALFEANERLAFFDSLDAACHFEGAAL